MSSLRLKTTYAFLLLLSLGILLSCQQRTGDERSADTSTLNLEEITIRQIQQGYREGKFTISEVVNGYIRRMVDLDKNGPKLNSVIVINPDAMKIAAELEKEMAEGKLRGPLHGIPVILKDNIDTHDSMPNTAGATPLHKSFPQHDSWVAQKLREA